MTLLDDLVHEPLQLWDPALLTRLRAEGKSETLFFEFKSEFDCGDVEKAVCAFANRLGGFLLVGVEASKPENVIDNFVGLDPEDWLRRVSDCIVGHLSPLPVWDTVQMDSPDAPGRFVVVTRVEASHRTPHIVARTGRIYVRNPAGSDPVTDKATLDALIARGTGGTEACASRAEMIHEERPASDLLSPPPDAVLIDIVAVPSPPLAEGAFGGILTRDGYVASAGIFPSPDLNDLRPRTFHRDRVHFVGGFQVAARYTDGSLYVRRATNGPTSGLLGVSTVAGLVQSVLEAAGKQEPSVHQVLLDVRISGALDSRLSVNEGGGPGGVPRLGVDPWLWRAEVGTHVGERERVGEEIRRAMWRTAGDPRGLA
jgi:hypothetical protein